MNLRHLASPTLMVLLCLGTVQANDLTLEQIESIKKRVEALQENLDQHVANRNTSAGDRFAAAASDPRAAVALYLDCHKLVNFDREGRPESDFRAWKEGQEDRLREKGTVESLQLQLRYLALSCKAAEIENIEEVFSPLMGYVESLSLMEELPTQALTSSVANSVFSKAFYLEGLLGNNQDWEATPFNIGGIYESTIFPHLRASNPSALMTAWDKRIEQGMRIARMIDEQKEAELRGMDREEQRRARDDQNRQRGSENNNARRGGAMQNLQEGFMKDLDMDDFVARTLPRLKWARLVDMFRYVDETTAMQEMLRFVEEHLKHELGEEFMSEFLQILDEAESSSDRLPGAVSE